MNPKRIAIIGSGITGLAAAYKLRHAGQVTLFEKDPRLGGHTNTVHVQEKNITVPIDTGFIVYNTTTYPQLTQLFEELNVATQASDMSFAIHNQNTNLQWTGSGLGGLFLQPVNWLKPKHYRFVKEILRFHKESCGNIDAIALDVSLVDYLKHNNYSDYFIENMIIPMASAIWSSSFETILDFPIQTLFRFFRNHGFIGVNTQLPWRTVSNGSQSYIKAITDQLKNHVIYIDQGVTSVERSPKPKVHTQHTSYEFDVVLIATHADQALKLLDRATQQEQQLLSCFHYSRNTAILHSDSSQMPSQRKAWSSWNSVFHKTDQGYQASTIYYMNRLQNLATKRDYFVSINPFRTIPEDKTYYATVYEHPIFDGPAMQAQQQLATLNQDGPVFFAGSYFRYGFHEDALQASLKAVERILQWL